MRYKIKTPVAYTRKMKTMLFFRWFFYAFSLVTVYSIMNGGFFGLCQPYFIISLAIGVSVREAEFSSAIFGIFCGFMLDMSLGTLFGFFAVFLMPCCFFASLLSRNLIKINLLNHIICTCITTAFLFGAHYLFNYAIWNTQGREIVLFKILVPSFVLTALTAPLMLFLTRLIANRLGNAETIDIDGAVHDVLSKSEENKNRSV